jgi:4-amino-4-deoxy-L-arabinose transferase-like glycosyltransferase
MQPKPYASLLLPVVILLISAFYLAGVADVPFHPDESTQLFMSQDLETTFVDPGALAWPAGAENDLRQHYRLMDSPLPRYWIGLGRWIAGQPPLASDWDWSQSWHWNVAQGALPTPGQLLAARWMMAMLFPFSLWLTYSTGARLAGPVAGWSALLLTAGNALVLLHTRRGMAEGLLLFTVTLSLWCLLRSGKRPWLVGLPLALAFLAKQSAAALLIPAALALMTPLGGEKRWRTRLRNSLLAGGIFLGLVFLFNPFLWNQPLAALEAALQARAAFTASQVQAHTQAGGALLANSIPQRLVGIIAQLYITPPAVADVGNYHSALQAATANYLGNPLHALLRGFAGGGVLFLLTLFGMLATGLQVVTRAKTVEPSLLIFATAGLAQTMVLLLVPVAFQRYSIILVPYSVVWIGMGIARVWGAISRKQRP